MSDIAITMLGYYGAGKTSYLVATYGEMQGKDRGFALDAIHSHQAVELQRMWSRLTTIVGSKERFPFGTGTINRYTFHLEYKANPTPLAAITWVDHPGGLANWWEPTNEELQKQLITQLVGSDCIFLCVPGEVVTAEGHRRRELYEQLQIPSLKNFIREVVRVKQNSEHKPLPVAVIITKADFCSDDLDDAIEDVIYEFAWLTKPSEPLGGPSHLVGFFPVTLGERLRYGDTYGEIAPQNVSGPILFAAWAQARQLVMDLSGNDGDSRKNKAIAEEHVRLLGEQLSEYVIMHDEHRLSDTEKLVSASVKDRPTPLQVFISHNAADKTFCDLLDVALRQAGIDVWYDNRSPDPGPVDAVVSRQIKARRVMIVVLSKKSLNAPWVQQEYSLARELGQDDPSRIILPVVASAFDRDDLDRLPFLRSLRRVEGRGGTPYPVPEAIERILDILRGILSDDDNVDTMIAKGKVLMAQHRYKDAATVLERATQLDDNSFDAWANLASFYLVRGRWVDSINASERALALDKFQGRAWAVLGDALYHYEDYTQEAVDAYNRAVTLDPNDAVTWSNMGLALGDLGRDREALVAYDRALALDGSVTEHWRARGDILLRLGREREANEAYQRAFEIDGRTPQE